jgi:hypothetical protein
LSPTPIIIGPDDTELSVSSTSPEDEGPLILDLDDEIIFHLANPDSVNELRAEQISTKLIYDKFARAVFEWQMGHVREHGRPATRLVLEDEFDGSQEDLPALQILEPETVVGDLISRLRERYIRNEGKASCKRNSLVSVEHPLDLPRSMMAEGRRLADLVARRGERYGHGDFPRALSVYEKNKERGQGPSLGYKALDEHFHGMLGLTFCVGSPKSYKSWVTANALIQNILQGRKCWLYSLELPAVESYWRIMCMAANVPYWKYLKGELMPSELNHVRAISQEVDEAGIFYTEKPPVGERGVESMIERAGNSGAEVIFLDQLQYVETRGGRSIGSLNNTGDYWEVCDDMRTYSDQIPLWIVHQFNRSVMNKDEMPSAQQGKGSAAIEETATLELGLWANKEMRANGNLHIGTLASRNHDHLTWQLEVQLSHGCALEMIGVVDEDADDGDE